MGEINNPSFNNLKLNVVCDKETLMQNRYQVYGYNFKMGLQFQSIINPKGLWRTSEKVGSLSLAS